MSKTQQRLDDLKANNQADQGKPLNSKADSDSIEQLRRRYIADAKRAVTDYLSAQKRSRLITIEPNPYQPDGDRLLVEIEFPQTVVRYEG